MGARSPVGQQEEAPLRGIGRRADRPEARLDQIRPPARQACERSKWVEALNVSSPDPHREEAAALKSNRHRSPTPVYAGRINSQRCPHARLHTVEVDVQLILAAAAL